MPSIAWLVPLRIYVITYYFPILIFYSYSVISNELYDKNNKIYKNTNPIKTIGFRKGTGNLFKRSYGFLKTRKISDTTLMKFVLIAEQKT